ncbi:hypothetical protein JIG36_13970 [Actinoplanes sp. LDG1-06]|uniref:GNAT family N-acetyltransferase n=1 Tax=Paractinoplanes ovalisporus TaxID=2810368 RepID=A0ABS2AA13_9ACTN|nr:hypothetical protein [Actinoplanes ovalisporus]MBM2616668.1 hypothetical protein [Actinoplanes ovalisporus]
MNSAETDAAVRNNADWVSAVCRAHGIGWTFGPRSWRSAGPTPQFYPEAITLRASAAPADVVRGSDSVKDSFAALDLTPYGFRPLFDAQWIFREAGPVTPGPAGRVTSETELRRWPAALNRALLDDPAVRVMAVRDGERLRGGFVLNRTGGVAGVSNLFAADTGDMPLIWSAATAAAGGLPMVGYEGGDDLEHARAAGFRAVGPLRVWLRDGL